MSLNRDEARAAAFITALLLVSGAVRWLDRPEPIRIDAPGVNLGALEAESRRIAAGATPPAPSPVRAPEQAHTEASRPPKPLDLNRATASELERLPRVGPVLAGRIVALRDSLGGFRDVAELERVRGIGPATLERLTPLVRVGPKH
ncbi:MAG: helix-hairpin-helix domain-containing protein [Gemmatimonadota bacterium]|jgi:competence protein ComEA